MPGFDDYLDDTGFGPLPSDGKTLADLLREFGKESSVKAQMIEERRTPPTYHFPSVPEVTGRLQHVSAQSTLRPLYNEISTDLGGRVITPADFVGTLVIRVAQFTAGQPLLVKSLVTTLIQDWIMALVGDDEIFENASGRFYANVLIGTVAAKHMTED